MAGNILRRPGTFFLIAYLVLFLVKSAFFRYVYSSTIAITGWNADAFLWSFVGKFLAENGLDWHKLSSLFEGYFSPTLSQAPFQGLFAPLYTLIVFLTFEFGGDLDVIRFLSIVAYALSFPIMDAILRRLGFRLITRWLVLLGIFFNIYTLSLSFKVRPDNFAFILMLVSVYMALSGRAVLSGIFFVASTLGFKVQMALWGYAVAYFILVNRGWRRVARFVLTVLAFLILYLPYYLWISNQLPALSGHLTRYNLVPLNRAFEIIPSWSIVHFVGLFGLGLLALFYIGGWIPISRFVLNLKGEMIPVPFPSRSHLPNFLLDMGYGYLWEVARRMKYGPSRILLMLLLSVTLFTHVLYGVRFLGSDFRDTAVEDKFLRKVEEYAERGRVCSIRSSRTSFYIPVPYLSLFHRNVNLDENPLWEPEKTLIEEKGCDYLAFIYYGSRPVQVMGREIGRNELVIMDSHGDVVYRDRWTGSYPDGFRFGKFALLLGGLLLVTAFIWEVVGTYLPLILRR